MIDHATPRFSTENGIDSNFIDQIDKYKNIKIIKRYLEKNKINIYYNKTSRFKIEETICPIRTDILRELINIYTT